MLTRQKARNAISAQILAARDTRCALCRSESSLEVDHLAPLFWEIHSKWDGRGGVQGFREFHQRTARLQTLCRPCHARKTRVDRAKWEKKIIL